MAYVIQVPYNNMTIDECAQRARNAFCGMRLRYTEVPGRIRATVLPSLLSWGEEINVCFYNSYFTVESKCLMPLQLVDWGKNKKNVDQFMYFFYA